MEKVILIEEAILFRDEKDFWRRPTLVL